MRARFPAERGGSALPAAPSPAMHRLDPSTEAIELWTDVPEFGNRVTPPNDRMQEASPWEPCSLREEHPMYQWLHGRGAYRKQLASGCPHAGAVVAVERTDGSLFDQMVASRRRGEPLPHGLVCVAGSGTAFHGYRGRSWCAVPGNLHLSVHWAPQRAISGYLPGVLALAAVACAGAVDELAGNRPVAGIKWVNDVLVGRDKIAGVLAWSQSEGERLDSIILGIGLNVEHAPADVNDAAVEGATCLAALRPGILLGEAFAVLLRHLNVRYEALVAGGTDELLAAYRARSVALGRRVRWVPDDAGPHEIIEAKAVAIADDLALVLDGRSEHLRSGRIALL